MKYTLILVLAMIFGTFVSHAQQETKKVIVIKKVKDDNGNIITENVEATGEDADQLIEKMKQDGSLEGIDIEVEIEKATQGKSHSKVLKEDIQIEKSIVNGKETTTYTITTNDNGEQTVMVWQGDGDMPQEMQDKIQAHKMRKIETDGEEMIYMIEEGDDDKASDKEIRIHVMTPNKVSLGVMVMDDNGVEIEEIIEDSPAEKAEIQIGDIILKVGGKYVFNTEMLLDRLSSYDKGDACEIVILRNDQEISKQVKF